VTKEKRVTRLSIAALAFGALLVSGAAPARAQANPERDLDAFIRRALADYQVPGAAVAVVRDGRVTLLEGYGVRAAGQPDRVDADTIFQLASVTKTLTGAVLGTLVDEKRVGWDDAVTAHLPEFVAFDPYLTRYLTVRDLLAMRTGFPAFTGDILDPMGYSRPQILARLRHLEPRYSLREVAQYSNPGFFLAGEVAARAGGAPWETLVQDRLLAPLAMARSGALSANLDRDANVSANHVLAGGQPVAVPATRADAIGASGSASSTASDMSHLMQMLLAGGRYGGRAVLASGTVAEMFRRSMVSAISFTELPPIDETTGFYYGLGVDSYDYRGEQVVEKAGALGGVRTIMTLLPSRRAGIVVLSNLNITTFPEAVRAFFLDAIAGVPPDAHQKAIAEANAAMARMFSAMDSPPANPGPFEGRLESLLGDYDNDLYGRCAIVAAGRDLAMECGPARYRGALRHFAHGEFRVQFPNPTTGPHDITFTIGEDGRAASFTDDALGLFTRVAPAATAGR
jgi:CubicO group peptidase (beta-lactamase class C family)